MSEEESMRQTTSELHSSSNELSYEEENGFYRCEHLDYLQEIVINLFSNIVFYSSNWISSCNLRLA